MNWYRVIRPHDAFAMNDMVLLPGNEREAWLEQHGFLRFVSVDQGTPPGPSKDEAFAPKRGRRGKSFEAGSPESEPVGAASGDEPRGEDL